MLQRGSPQVGWYFRVLKLNLLKEIVVVVAIEWVPPHAHIVQSNTAGPVVSLAAMVLLSLASLRREEYSRSRVITSDVGAIRGEHGADPEISQLHVIILIKKYVLWLYVPMKNLYHLMAVLQSLHQLSEDFTHHIVITRFLPVGILSHFFLQISLLHELSDQIELLLFWVVYNFVQFD